MTHEVSVVADHPVTRGVPKTFSITDELYLYEVFEEDVVPLLRSGHEFVRDNFYSAAKVVREGRMFSNEGWEHDRGSNLIGWVKHYRNESDRLPAMRRRPEGVRQSALSDVARRTRSRGYRVPEARDWARERRQRVRGRGRMPLEVIGAGYGRTGTLSLKLALERLGFTKCYHMMEVFRHPEHVPMWAAAHRGEPVDWEQLYDGYRATVDWPSCNLWREHAALYPNAKVILSTRDPDSWYDSVMNTIYTVVDDAQRRTTRRCERFGEWACDITWKQRVRQSHGRSRSRDHGVTTRTSSTSRRRCRNRVCWCSRRKQGWEPLCRFLGVDVPDEPYPRVNTTEDFSGRTVSAALRSHAATVSESAADRTMLRASG